MAACASGVWAWLSVQCFKRTSDVCSTDFEQPLLMLQRCGLHLSPMGICASRNLGWLFPGVASGCLCFTGFDRGCLPFTCTVWTVAVRASDMLTPTVCTSGVYLHFKVGRGWLPFRGKVWTGTVCASEVWTVAVGKQWLSALEKVANGCPRSKVWAVAVC